MVACYRGMAARGGPEIRQAALRYACYLLRGAVGNLQKPLFGHAQPRHRRIRKPRVVRGAFPSGHARRRSLTYSEHHWTFRSLSSRWEQWHCLRTYR